MTKTQLSKMHGRRINQFIKDKDVSVVLDSLCKTIDELSEEIVKIKKRLSEEDQQ